MISVGNNKAVICKGDFHPAALYKGDKKIAGYTVEDFEGTGGAMLENCYNDKLHNAQIFGNSIQDGTPTPEAPVEVQSVGELVTEGEYTGKYKIPVTARGKNLVSVPKLLKSALSLNGLTAEPYDTDKIRVYGTPTVSGSYINLKGSHPQYECSLKAGTIVRASVSLDPTYNNITGGCIYHFQCGLYSKSGWVINAQSQQWKGQTLTSDVTRVYGFNVLINPKDTETYLDFVMCPQFEVGSEPTPYEPYIEPQTFNIYLDEPLRKVGEYANYVDFEKSTVLRNVEKRVFDGTEAWRAHGTKNLLNTTKATPIPDTTSKIIAMSSHFVGIAWGKLYGNIGRADGNLIVGIAEEFNNGSEERYIYVCPYSTMITPAEWKAQLATWYEEGNPFTVWYALATEEEPIELPELPTFKGTTIYEIDTDIPATISGKYKKVEE